MSSRLLSTAANNGHGHCNLEQLWRQFFSDPSQWWDHTIHKVNSKYPDFKHKTTGVALWIDRRSNPSWVQTAIASMTQGSVSRTLYSWNVLIAKCVKSNQELEALKLYDDMQAEGTKPDTFTFTKTLNACASSMAVEDGRRIHSHVIYSGCESDVFVGSTLVDMYAKCGYIKDAERVFHKMHTRDVVSWTAMLGGYVKCKQEKKALELFALMQEEGVKPNPVTFVVVLTACASIMALEEGRQVHTQLMESGCESDLFVGSTLVDMYVKCGSIEDAQRVFHKMPTRSLVSWNAMLAGFVKCKQGQKALELFILIQEQDLKPDTITFVLALNACACIVALEEGRHIHKQLIESGCEDDVFVGSTLVDMYAKCRSIKDAERVFHKMPTRNVVSWNAMLRGYEKCAQEQKALELFSLMHENDVMPDQVTFGIVLNTCANIKALEEGRHVHKQLMQGGWESDMFVGSALIDMYAKCGSIEDAQRVFHKIPTQTLVSWNALLAGYEKSQQGYKALELFALMSEKMVKPDSFTFVVLLNACASIISLEEGRKIHTQVIQSGSESDVFVASALVGMYSKCGSIEDAERVFHTMPTQDVVLWTSMLSGYVKCEQEQKALELFALMQEGGMKADPVTFVVLLTACGSIMALEEGRKVHAKVIQSSYECDVCVASALVDMYAKCGSMEDAQRVFCNMPTQNLCSWTAMFAGFFKCDEGQKALNLYLLMQEQKVEPDPCTFVVILSVCISLMALEEGRLVHAQVIQNGCESDVFVGGTLVHMYAKCSSIKDAERVFNKMQTPDVVSWTAMLAGYVRCEEGEKALKLFALMQKSGVQPDSATFVVVLNACTSVMALEEGKRVHAQVIQNECESEVFIGNTLVDMYAKCGSIDDARQVFQKMPIRDAVSWTAMLGGLAMHGQGKEALELFKKMHKAGVEISMVTFICLLSACSHGGLVEEGLQLFECMGSTYGISQTVEHYVCMVDLLGRAGRLDEAVDFLRREPKFSEDSVALIALLSACRNHGKVQMGEHIGQKLLELEPGNGAGYMLFSNIYAAAGQ